MGSIHVELMVSCNRGENATDQLTEPITGSISLVFDPSSFQLNDPSKSMRAALAGWNCDIQFDVDTRIICMPRLFLVWSGLVSPAGFAAS